MLNSPRVTPSRAPGRRRRCHRPSWAAKWSVWSPRRRATFDICLPGDFLGDLVSCLGMVDGWWEFCCQSSWDLKNDDFPILGMFDGMLDGTCLSVIEENHGMFNWIIMFFYNIIIIPCFNHGFLRFSMDNHGIIIIPPYECRDFYRWLPKKGMAAFFLSSGFISGTFPSFPATSGRLEESFFFNV